MNTAKLGELERVAVRTIWPDEARDFTPWLAGEANIRALGAELGIDLEVQMTEQRVGPYSADIWCKNTPTDEWVLIENQFGRTDHSHLGQLLTYTGGLNAGTMIWIAERFTEEHRAALDWLNRMTNENVSFFGLEIEVWRIGDSKPAPKFNLVSKPNDWTKSVISKRAGTITERQQLQLEFWTAFQAFLANRTTPLRGTKPLPRHWMNLALGRTGVHLSAVASLYDSERETYESNELRAEVVTSGANAAVYFTQLSDEKGAIESELGEPLIWYESAGQMRRIYLRQPANLSDRNAWTEHHAWLFQALERLHRVFGPRVRSLLSGQ